MENSCVIIRFDLEEDLVRVWVNGHISFGRTCIILTKWQPMMDDQAAPPVEEEPQQAPVLADEFWGELDSIVQQASTPAEQ